MVWTYVSFLVACPVVNLWENLEQIPYWKHEPDDLEDFSEIEVISCGGLRSLLLGLLGRPRGSRWFCLPVDP